MSRSVAVVATILLLVSQLPITAANARQLSAKCWKFGNPIPEYVDLDADSQGRLTWNGVSADWKVIQHWLVDLHKTIAQDWNVHVEIRSKIPHEREIETMLAKEGIHAQPANCRVPAPVVVLPN